MIGFGWGVGSCGLSRISPSSSNSSFHHQPSLQSVIILTLVSRPCISLKDVAGVRVELQRTVKLQRTSRSKHNRLSSPDTPSLPSSFLFPLLSHFPFLPIVQLQLSHPTRHLYEDGEEQRHERFPTVLPTSQAPDPRLEKERGRKDEEERG